MIIIEYTIKNDIIFNYLFSQSDVLKEFLEACLNKKIEEVEVTNQFSLKKMKYHDKVGVLDVKAKINKSEVVDIEMQRNEQSFYVQRVLLYTGGFIRGQLQSGDKYEDLKDVIMINVLNFNIFDNIDDVHTIWRLRADKHQELGPLKGLEVHFFELEKFRKSNPDLHDKLNQWLVLIDTENEKWLEVAMSENKKIKEAKDKVDDFMSEDEARILVELREKWELDYNSSISDAKRIGIEKGLAEGRAEGLEKGRAEGLEKGRAELEKERKEIARNLLTMNMDIKQIAKATGLTEEEILKLKK